MANLYATRQRAKHFNNSSQTQQGVLLVGKKNTCFLSVYISATEKSLPISVSHSNFQDLVLDVDDVWSQGAAPWAAAFYHS